MDALIFYLSKQSFEIYIYFLFTIVKGGVVDGLL
jgi:hypothetical protein